MRPHRLRPAADQSQAPTRRLKSQMQQPADRTVGRHQATQSRRPTRTRTRTRRPTRTIRLWATWRSAPQVSWLVIGPAKSARARPSEQRALAAVEVCLCECRPLSWRQHPTRDCAHATTGMTARRALCDEAARTRPEPFVHLVYVGGPYRKREMRVSAPGSTIGSAP
eukprot:2006343-Prymnesium_polylepis.1